MIPILIAASAVAALTNCVTQNTVALGATTHEPADAVIQAADGRCAQEWDRVLQYQQVGSLGAANSGGAFEQLFQQDQRLEERRVRGLVYSQAFEALMKARAQ